MYLCDLASIEILKLQIGLQVYINMLASGVRYIHTLKSA